MPSENIVSYAKQSGFGPTNNESEIKSASGNVSIEGVVPSQKSFSSVSVRGNKLAADRYCSQLVP